QTMNARLNANKEVFANGKRVIGTDGTLYFRGDNLDNRYLGKTAKAVSAGTADYASNAGKLNGIAASNYALKNAVNVWDANQTFNKGINVLSTASLNSLAVSGNSTFNGSSTFNGTVAMNRGVNVSGGNVQVNSVNDVRVGAISVKDLNNRLTLLESDSGGGGGVQTGAWAITRTECIENSYGPHGSLPATGSQCPIGAHTSGWGGTCFSSQSVRKYYFYTMQCK
ncbi:TPA: hypothetical protein ACF371_004714, partial [Vibrio parahaemolyticus]